MFSFFQRSRFQRVSKSQGYTFVELLVIVAIVAVLTTIILISIKSSRGKAADTAVKRYLNQMRGAAATVYDTTGTYDTFCDASTETGKLYRDAYEQGTKMGIQTQCLSSSVAASKCMTGISSATCAAMTPPDTNFDKWAVTVQLKGKSGYWFCADYRGIIQEQNTRGISTNPIDYDC